MTPGRSQRFAVTVSPCHSSGQSPLREVCDVRYESLDHWRGLACLMIAAFHSVYYAELEQHCTAQSVGSLLLAAIGKFWVGVPMFFVISGYCISATIDSHRRRGKTVCHYFRRRFARIYPPYWIVLACVALIVGLTEYWMSPGLFADGVHPIHPPWEFGGWQWVGSLTLTESWRHHVIGSNQGFVLSPAWTLCYEEQFYAVAGALLLLPARWYFASALAVTVACALTRGVCYSLRVPIVGFFFDGGWLMFSAGIASYYAINYATRTGRCWTGMVLFFGFVSFVVLAAVGVPLGEGRAEWWFAGPSWLAPAFGFSLLIVLIHRWDRRLAGSKVLRPLRLCGLMCYSMYLVHWPICKAISHLVHESGVETSWGILGITVPLCMIASLGAASCVYLAVERHCVSRRTPKPRNQSATTPIRLNAGGIRTESSSM
jgi:peptidoglycan/LPS O-acetylase OafA/YrhL